jgi:hypothetical protein
VLFRQGNHPTGESYEEAEPDKQCGDYHDHSRSSLLIFNLAFVSLLLQAVAVIFRLRLMTRSRAHFLSVRQFSTW